MFKFERTLTTFAIAVAISLPAISAVQAKHVSDKNGYHQSPSPRAIYNVVRDPATMGNRAGEGTKMFTPEPLDPNYHGGGVG